MRNWKETLEWYDNHQTKAQLGFDPEGMCLRICREARDLPAVYPSAKVAQDNTPLKYRVHKVADLRRGMVGYFDDPNDSNRFGHIATMVGRVRGGDLDDLGDTLWETNSVVSDQVVVVRGDYFAQHWGDSFKFGAVWLNGEVLDVPVKKKPEPKGQVRLENFRESGNNWNVNILDRLVASNRPDLRRKVEAIDDAVKDLPQDEENTRVKEFKKRYKDDRVLQMHLLNKAVEEGRTGVVRDVRNRLRYIIKSINKQ